MTTVQNKEDNRTQNDNSLNLAELSNETKHTTYAHKCNLQQKKAFVVTDMHHKDKITSEI